MMGSDQPRRDGLRADADFDASGHGSEGGDVLALGGHALPPAGPYARRLADHASDLQDQAREALLRGDTQRAALLIDRAQLLAEDVHGLVEDLEAREASDLLTRIGRADARPVRRRLTRIGAMLGTGLALSVALVEC